MVIETTLLASARTAGRALAEAERAALLARADYHTAVRRMHLAGATLREIGEALSLSHQRVQQIVNQAGGTWWMVGRSRARARDAVCSWCSRPPAEVSKLIAGPNVYICDSCVATARANFAAASSSGRSRCSFCQRKPTTQIPVLAGSANICADCLKICNEIT